MDSPTKLLLSNGLSGVELEYALLREEMLRRSAERQQVLSITLTLGGAFLGLGWGSGAVALLLYPPLAALLAAGWAQNEIRARRLNIYIRDYLEPQMPGLGYERFNREQERASRLGAWPVDILAIGGIFFLTQLLAVGLSFFKFNSNPVEWLLLALAVGSLVLLLVIVEYVRRQSIR